HFNDQPVYGLREGSWIRVHGMSMELKGEHTARIFTLNHVKDVLEIRMEHF
ncbi:MAG: hypothetical protein ISP75_02260, partial [Cryomorphaceae bacterium]|nr:hypothetical protein [Cryomorphaceae bacterium]